MSPHVVILDSADYVYVRIFRLRCLACPVMRGETLLVRVPGPQYFNMRKDSLLHAHDYDIQSYSIL
jgi:hypothetical protein